MIGTIENAFIGGFKTRYDNIFKQYYPAHNNTGFTERNLTCNFANALIDELGTDTIVWYEAPLPISEKGKYQHVDAVVFSKKNNSVFFIEAKRFGDKPTGKITLIKNDLSRLMSPDNVLDSIKNEWINRRDYVLKEWGWKENNEQNHSINQYVICISDFWVNNSYSFDQVEKMITEMKMKETFIESFVHKICSFESETCLKNYSIFIIAFKI